MPLHCMLFHFIPHYFTISHAVVLYDVHVVPRFPWYPMPLYSMLFHAIPCYSAISHAIILYAIPCYYALFVPWYPMPLYCMLFHVIPRYSMISHAIILCAIPCEACLTHLWDLAVRGRRAAGLRCHWVAKWLLRQLRGSFGRPPMSFHATPWYPMPLYCVLLHVVLRYSTRSHAIISHAIMFHFCFFLWYMLDTCVVHLWYILGSFCGSFEATFGVHLRLYLRLRLWSILGGTGSNQNINFAKVLTSGIIFEPRNTIYNGRQMSQFVPKSCLLLA